MFLPRVIAALELGSRMTHERARMPAAVRLLVPAWSLALLLAGCLGADEAPAEPLATDDEATSVSERADPSPPAPDDAAGEAGTTGSAVHTTVHELAGKMEPNTFVGSGVGEGHLGLWDPSLLQFPVPPNAVAVRVELSWTGSAGLDLLVRDDTAPRCSLMPVELLQCNVDFALQADAQGSHWVKGASSPATIDFDDAALRAGCPEESCEWSAQPYAKASADTTFHLVVEVDTLEPSR